MTLILTLVSPSGVIQVGDRLLTRGTLEFDRHANKNVIFAARDAVFTLGYSGPAYIDGIPTDTWLGEQLVGAELRDLRGFGGLDTSGVVDIGLSSIRVREALQRVFRAMPNPIRCYVVGAGVQWNDGRGRVSAFEIHNYGDESKRTFALERQVPRDLAPEKFMVFENPWVLADEEADQLGVGLKASRGLDGIEACLVDAVRGVGARSPLVGQDCMVVRIAPGDPLVMARYVPLREETATIGEGPLEHVGRGPSRSRAGAVVPVAYSPLIIGDRSFHSPSAMVGSFSVPLGSARVALVGQESRGFAALTSQRRPADPTRP